jgi:sulfite exporter TauE/SafE
LPDTQLLSVLGMGFLLGARHALDADHVAAMATLLSRRPSLRASGLIGASWGSGHTVVLLLVGLTVVGFKIAIPERLAAALEYLVGLMLVGLGTSLAATLIRERWHVHPHAHEGATHLHLHRHDRHGPEDHVHEHWLRGSVKPFLIGMVHGLAGSAALALMVLSTVQTLWQGAAYILLFGLGSVLGMVLLGAAFTVPLARSRSGPRLVLPVVQGLASLGSIGLGLNILLS